MITLLAKILLPFAFFGSIAGALVGGVLGGRYSRMSPMQEIEHSQGASASQSEWVEDGDVTGKRQLLSEMTLFRQLERINGHLAEGATLTLSQAEGLLGPPTCIEPIRGNSVNKYLVQFDYHVKETSLNPTLSFVVENGKIMPGTGFLSGLDGVGDSTLQRMFPAIL